MSARRTATYIRGGLGGEVAGEEASGRGGLARIVEVSLGNAVVSCGEVELEHITSGGSGLVGTEDQATSADLDLDGRSAGLHRQAGGEEESS